MSKLVKLATRIRSAETAMERELARRYPVLSIVRCWIMWGQVTPSRGEVISHPGGRHAYVRVRLFSRTREVRDVPAYSIIDIIEQ